MSRDENRWRLLPWPATASFGTLFLFIGAGLLWMGMLGRKGQMPREFAIDGKKAVATVNYAGAPPERGPYPISYTYKVGTQTYNDTALSEIKRNKGDYIEVTYLSSHPYRSTLLDPKLHPPRPAWDIGVGGISFGIGVVLLLVWVVTSSRERSDP